MRNRPADVYSYTACKLSDICQKKQITNIISTPVYDAIQTGTDEVLKGNLKAALGNLAMTKETILDGGRTNPSDRCLGQSCLPLHGLGCQ